MDNAEETNGTQNSASPPCSADGALQINAHYTDGVVSSRVVRAGDNVSIMAGAGYYIDKITIFPAVRGIDGVKMSHGENSKRETAVP